MRSSSLSTLTNKLIDSFNSLKILSSYISIYRTKRCSCNSIGDGPTPIATSAVNRNGIYARILGQKVIVTYANDRRLIGTLLTKLNGRVFGDISQETLDSLLTQTDCTFETMTPRNHAAILPSLPGIGFQTYRHPNIQHSVLTFVTVRFTQQTGFNSGDILLKIRNIDTITLEAEEVERLIRGATFDQLTIIKRAKYQRIIDRKKLFRSIPQEWDFENLCPHCSYLYLKGKLTPRIESTQSCNRYSSKGSF